MHERYGLKVNKVERLIDEICGLDTLFIGTHGKGE
jgi:hypothetical protein